MATMTMGFTYDRGKKVGYDIVFGKHGFLSFVSSKDKSRIIKEIKQQGYTKNQILVHRRESND